MKSLFVLRRPGIVVASGIVKQTGEDTLVLENQMHFPVSGRDEACRLHLEANPESLRNLGLRPGDAVIATCSDDFKVEMLMEGGEIPDRDFYLKAFNIRYNGAFDFDAFGQEKEQHVFSGSVLDFKEGQKDDRKWVRLILSWKRKGKSETRNLIYFPEGEFPPLKKGMRAIFLAGEKRVSNYNAYYISNRFFMI